MRMLSGDANPFHRSFSPSRLVQSKMKTFRALENQSFKTVYKPKPPETIIAEDLSDSNVSILSSQSLDFSDGKNVSKREMITKGKFSGMTLQETLAWRHQISANASHRKLDIVPRKKIRAREESFEQMKVESVPDFMLARANLRKTNEKLSKGIRVARSICSITADSTLSSLGTERESRDQGTTQGDLESRDECSYRFDRNRLQDVRDSDTGTLLTPDVPHLVSTQEAVEKEKKSDLNITLSPIPQDHHSQIGENASCSVLVEQNDAKAILNAMLLSRKREQSPKAMPSRTKDCTNELESELREKPILHERRSMSCDTRNTTTDSCVNDRSNIESKLNCLPSNPFSISSIPPGNGEKYSKMLKMGVPLTAVQNSMIRDGVEPSSFRENLSNQTGKRPQQKKDPYRRTRLHWTPVQNYSRDSIWYQINNDSEFQNIPIDEDEFQSLFQIKVQPTNHIVSRTKDNSNYGVVKVIDAKRANNGGIILAGLRMTFEEIATAVDLVDETFFTAQQVKGLLEYIPTLKERQALNAFLSSGDDNSISNLSECERFMVSLFPVDHVKEKMEVMLFKLQFPSAMKDFTKVIGTLSRACDEILHSQKLKTILGTVLKIGNHLNQAGVTAQANDALAFELESLAKLKQVKAWDRKTTVLSYVSSIIFKWNEPVLSIKDELPNVLKVSSFNENDYEESLNTLTQQMISVQKIMSDHDIVPTTKFFLDASEALDDLNKSNLLLKKKFGEVLDYLAENRSLKPIELFCSLSSFCNDIESVYSHLKFDKNIKDRSNWRKNLRKYN